MRRLVGLLGVGAAALLLSSCINFGPPLTGSVGTGPTVDTGPIAAGDVDGDGRPEALVMKSDGQLWWVQRCTFDQCLFPTGSVTPPAGVQDLATGDFDENGVDDVVAAGTGGVQVFFGHDMQDPPGGGLTQSGSPLLTGAPRTRVVAADLNHDGDLDVGVIGGSRYEYFPGDGAGHFLPAVLVYEIPYPFVGTVDELAAGDIDGNGWPEGIISVTAFNTLTRTFGWGLAGFESTTLKLTYLGTSSLAGALELCDLDGDGAQDLAHARGGVIWLMRPTADPQFGLTFTGLEPGGGPTVLSAPTAITSVRVRDFDANGTCDVVAGRQGGVSWWHGNGDGTFVTVNGNSRIDRNIPDVKSIEVSLDAGDNMPDLFVSQGQPNGRLSWLENKSSN